MGTVLISIAAFIVAIGLLVAVHEFGHYWVARRLGIKVLRFSIGFGKPMWKRIAGADRTEYVIANIPLGGYVKMLDEREGPVPESERHRAFNRQPVWKRSAVLAAGPVFNFLFAIVAYWAMFMIGVPGLKPIVGEVDAGSYVGRAGMQQGDEILAVGGVRTATWEGAILAMLDEMLDDGRIPLRVQGRDGSERELLVDVEGEVHRLTEPGQLFVGLGIRRWDPPLPAELGEIVPDAAADRAGLRSGDLVLAADGEPIDDWRQWVEYIQARPDVEVALTIERDGRELVLPLRIGSVEQDGEVIGRIGAAPHVPESYAEQLQAEQRYGPVRAIEEATVKSWEMATLTLRMFWNMIVGEVSIKNISGPINIAQYAGYTASIGLVPFLRFLAVVSISLGLINLMPVPMLDGGQLVYAAVEAVKGSPLSQRAELIGQQVGIAVLILLMGLAFYNDITGLVG